MSHKEIHFNCNVSTLTVIANIFIRRDVACSNCCKYILCLFVFFVFLFVCLFVCLFSCLLSCL